MRPVNKRRQTIRWLAAAGVVVATGMTVTAVARFGHGGESDALQTPVPFVGGVHTVVHHSGTIIGSSTLPRNAFLHFVNPADQKVSILIHLANGNFVAYERACTHVGISVDYDPQTQTLICPAHGAVLIQPMAQQFYRVQRIDLFLFMHILSLSSLSKQVEHEKESCQYFSSRRK